MLVTIRQRWWFLLLLFLLWSFCQADRLHVDEVKALEEIGKELGKKDWNFSVDPCSNHKSWQTPKNKNMTLYNNTLNCTCSNGTCHVISLFLMGQDLSGVLPPSLAKLPYLQIFDFTRNYLNGTIPKEWTSMKSLLNLTVTVNRLTGPIPEYLGEITTLIYLNLENNLFSGTVPPQLGKLVNLLYLNLNANNLTGSFPVNALSKLTNLTELRISSNSFKGKIPDFHNLSNLIRVEIQASGFVGPIPSSISVLSKIEDLRISDLNGHQGSGFPPLQNKNSLRRLMLRSCNLSGPIPDYLTKMENLQNLDLSFNRLEGQIPDLSDLMKLERMDLTSNLLNGIFPPWITKGSSKRKADLSYNNFSNNSIPNSCNDTPNLYRSFYSKNNASLSNCLDPCKEDQYSFYINCGGNETRVGKIKYEGDKDVTDTAKFIYTRGVNWGISTTGDFWGLSKGSPSIYTAINTSNLYMSNSDLYANARLSPLSLTYFARCLANGNYTVKLHFAEIVIRDNRSFYSLGRRIFDVYVQEQLVLKDFNIAKEANGVDKPIIKNFTNVSVKYKVLEIRFHWSGKGTTAVPSRGTYGPLISAISINSEFKPPEGLESRTKAFISGGAVLLVLVLAFLILILLWWKGYFEGNLSREKELKGLDLQTGFFTFRQIKAATDNFDPANKLGEGGFGSVYKGVLLDGSLIAVKQLSSKSKQGNREFVNEIGMISGLNHPNLVRLFGCCVEGNQLFLVYEFMENNSLARALFGPEQGRLNLDWPQRTNICIGIAKGLAFLHEESALRVVHRDIKSTNILLDKDLNPKISDFGLAKLDEEDNTHISTRVAGTVGYMAPEYALWGYLTYKADVYSYGVVALEVVAGKSNMKYRPNENYVCLVDWALVLQQKGSFMELIDPKLEYDFDKDEAMRLIKVAILCINPSPALRPTMSAVVSMLEGRAPVHDLLLDPSIYRDEERFATLRDQFNQIVASRSSTENQSLMHSSVAKSDDPPDSIVVSGNDLYEIMPESQNYSTTISLLSSHGNSTVSNN